MDMNLEDDDDYDFLDDSDDAEQREQVAAARLPQKKYMKLLQRIADRIENEITIELDDLVTVGTSLHAIVLRMIADSSSQSTKTV